MLKGRPPKTTEQFIADAQARYGMKFDYSRVKYVNTETDVEIICPMHGLFSQRPANHLYCKEGCYQCGKMRAGKNHRLTQEQFIERALKVHAGFYDYSKAEYIGAFIPVVIICSKHGEFEQTPNDHVFHANGCKYCGYECNMSYGERMIANYLTKWNIGFEPQKEFNGLKGRKNSNLRFDFYLPAYDLLVEFDGPHHDEPITYKGTTKEMAAETYRRTIVSDKKKERYAKKHGFELLRISYADRTKIKDILTTTLEIDS